MIRCHPWDRIALFKPAFCATMRPGSVIVPFALAVMFDTRGRSTKITCLVLASSVVALCDASTRHAAIRRMYLRNLPSAFALFFDPFSLRSMRCCNNATRAASADDKFLDIPGRSTDADTELAVLAQAHEDAWDRTAANLA